MAFEGGQMPMPRRIPKRGFKNPFRIEAFPINVATLDKIFESGATVDLDVLRAKGLVPKLVDYVKILGEGELTKPLTIKAYRASATAREKIERAGGTIEVAMQTQPQVSEGGGATG
jgi:large subunit ribosomal protein L15